MKRKLLSLALATTLTAGMLTACSDDAGKTQPSETGETTASTTASDEVPVDRNYDGEIPEIGGEWGKSVTFTAANGPEPDVVVAKTLIEGSGEEVGADDIVAAHYHGMLWDGTVFDSTFDRAPEGKNSEPLVFSLNQVIKGWKHGLAGQRVGDRVELVIPAAYGYGKAGAGDKIPGGATLVFVVDLVGKLDPTNTSALENARTTDNKPPAGLSIEGPLGMKPTIAFDHDAKAPTEATAIELAAGSGPKIAANDAVSYHITGSQWGKGDDAESTWDMGLAEYSQQAIGNTLGFANMSVGSRVLVIHPDTQNPENAMVFVVEITGAMDVSPVQ